MSAPAIRHPGEARWENRLLGVVSAVLIAFGVAAVANATLTLRGEGAVGSARVLKQIAGAAAGAGLAYFVSLVDYRRYKAWAWPILGAVVFLLLLVKFGPAALAPASHGARRWLKLPGLPQFQPSELARIAIAIWAAMLATKKGELMRSFTKGTLPFLVVLGAVFILIERQPNLSMAMLVAMTGGVVLFVAGARIGHVVVAGFGSLVAAGVVIALTGYRSRRVLAWFGAGDANEALGTGYQQWIANLGIASGGITGVGYGKGQLKLGHMPEAGTDFLFATIGEEWGFVGVAFVVLLYAAFCWMGFRIARTAADPFGTYLAAGLTFGIGFPAFAHMAVDLGILPVTGLTLPFMSSGLSSLLTNCLTVGILLSIGHARGKLTPAARA